MPKTQIIVAPDLSILVEKAAARIAARVSQSDTPVAVCLTGGSTPKPVYDRLAREPYKRSLPWDKIHWFWGDDRFVPIEDERSNAGMAIKALLRETPVPPDNIHPIPTERNSLGDASRIYQEELKSFYGQNQLDPMDPLFDIVLMGFGADGHTASLFPGTSTLTETDRWVLGVEEAGLEPFVPRITLTFPVMASTKEMLFLVSGQGKQEILSRVLAGENFPATSAYAEGDLIWLVDRKAAPQEFPEGVTTLGSKE